MCDSRVWEQTLTVDQCDQDQIQHHLFVWRVRFILTYKHATNLLGLDSGLAAVSSVIVTEGSVVDRVAVVVSHEWLYQRDSTSIRQKHWARKVPPLNWLIMVKRSITEEAFCSSGSFLFADESDTLNFPHLSMWLFKPLVRLTRKSNRGHHKLFTAQNTPIRWFIGLAPPSLLGLPIRLSN